MKWGAQEATLGKTAVPHLSARTPRGERAESGEQSTGSTLGPGTWPEVWDREGWWPRDTWVRAAAAVTAFGPGEGGGRARKEHAVPRPAPLAHLPAQMLLLWGFPGSPKGGAHLSSQGVRWAGAEQAGP